MDRADVCGVGNYGKFRRWDRINACSGEFVLWRTGKSHMEFFELLPEYSLFFRTCGIGDAGKAMVEEKGDSDGPVAALDRCIRWIPVQHPVGSQEPVCISLLCIHDPVCTGGNVSDGTLAQKASNLQKE